jgi:hypothetical protein
MGRTFGLQSTGTPLCASAITSPDVGSTCVGKHRGEGAGCDMLETELAMQQQLQLQQLTCRFSSVGHGLDSKSWVPQTYEIDGQLLRSVWRRVCRAQCS